MNSPATWSFGEPVWRAKCGAPLELVPGLELVDAHCPGTLDDAVVLFLRDRGLRMHQAPRVFGEVARRLGMAPGRVKAYFSHDGDFFPDELFSRQNPYCRTSSRPINAVGSAAASYAARTPMAPIAVTSRRSNPAAVSDRNASGPVRS